jgi:hypothetical protein
MGVRAGVRSRHFFPPILTFPRQGGRNLYLPLSALDGGGCGWGGRDLTALVSPPGGRGTGSVGKSRDEQDCILPHTGGGLAGAWGIGRHRQAGDSTVGAGVRHPPVAGASHQDRGN